MTGPVLRSAILAALSHVALSDGCTSSLDCSLNGDCADGICHCDAPWSGGVCETMRFKPVKKIQGYGMKTNLTSWGGGAIFDGSKYHLYVSAMTNDCPLSTWTKNSRIDHATADSVDGPYDFQDVAVNTWSHNAAPVVLPDGSFAIFHIGDGSGAPDGGQDCTPSIFDTEMDSQLKLSGGSSIHISKSFEGPWEPLEHNTLGGCNNPAPWVHANGTIYIVCGGTLKRAENISGPWTDVTDFSHDGGPAGHYEDPVLYTDKRGFHLFYHVYNYADHDECVDATVSAHVYSEDGYTWHASPTQPFSTQIEVEDGTTITVSTRERPKLFFDASGQMTHLFNGVCFATQCPSEKPCVDCKYSHWDYTLAQPLDLSPPTPAPFPPSPPSPSLPGCANEIEGFQCHENVCSGNANGGDCGVSLDEPDLDCKTATDPWGCALTKARDACDNTDGCASFGLSSRWGLYHAKLFSSGEEGLVSNSDWSVWVRSTWSV